MIGRVLLAAILAGFAAGLVMTAIQFGRLTPLILQAETFEHVAHGHSGEAHSHGDEAWTPADGFERMAYTAGASILTAIGFAMALAGLAMVSGRQITKTNGWIWGVCGFLVVCLAPASILPPLLPGMADQAFSTRMFGWAGCIILTGMGVWILTSSNRLGHQMGAWGAIGLAQVTGWSQLKISNDVNLPASLSAHFVTSSLAANFAMWLIIGWLLGHLFDRWKLNHD
jgi:cobalt transporter subunit CbtA